MYKNFIFGHFREIKHFNHKSKILLNLVSVGVLFCVNEFCDGLVSCAETFP